MSTYYAINIHTVNFLTAISANRNSIRHSAALKALRAGADVVEPQVSVVVRKGEKHYGRVLSPLALLALRAATFPQGSTARNDALSVMAHIRKYGGADAFVVPTNTAIKDITYTRGGLSSEEAAYTAMDLLIKVAKGEVLTREGHKQQGTMAWRAETLAKKPAKRKPKKKAKRLQQG